MKLDDDNYTVIGVMPPDFEDVLASSAHIWTPTQYDLRHLTGSFNTWEWGNHLRMVGRVKPEASRLQAVQELAQIARTPWPQFPRPRWASLEHGLIVDSLQDDIVHTVKPALLAVLGAVILVLAIAWVNVVNLVLAARRSATRRICCPWCARCIEATHRPPTGHGEPVAGLVRRDSRYRRGYSGSARTRRAQPRRAATA